MEILPIVLSIVISVITLVIASIILILIDKILTRIKKLPKIRDWLYTCYPGIILSRRTKMYITVIKKFDVWIKIKLKIYKQETIKCTKCKGKKRIQYTGVDDYGRGYPIDKTCEKCCGVGTLVVILKKNGDIVYIVRDNIEVFGFY